MNHDDRQLIAQLFERMRSLQHLDKDAEAENFIHQSMRDNADSPYLLVQSVLAQEVALQQAGDRIEELERLLTQGSPQSTGRASAGFSRPANNAVPAGQPAPWQQTNNGSDIENGPRTGNTNVWGAPVNRSLDANDGLRGAPATSAPAAVSSSGIPSTGKARDDKGQQRRGGGGFMQQAMTTAAGVAGGMLLANSIGSLFGGSNAANAADGSTSTAGTQATSTAQDPTASDASTADAQSANNDASASADSNVQEASHDDDWGAGDDWGGDDWGGGDFEL